MPVATATSAVLAPGCCRRASDAPSSGTVLPPGRTSCDCVRLSTTGSDPTVVTSTSSPLPTGTLDEVTSSTVPLAVVVTLVISPVAGTTTYTVPSWETWTTPSPPTSAVGSRFSASNEATPANGTTHSRPSSPSRTATVEPPSATFAPVGGRTVPSSFSRATSTGLTDPAPSSTSSTLPAFCSTSNEADDASSDPSRAWDSKLNRPSAPPEVRVTHTPESLSSTSAVA